ncbi:SDR family oxidoreductase [Haliangium ochraceum]|uniref:NmrA family protein n=1 Tax=Haliangium ochraceum (strain DSM 14365 / JCM 11303 / SMP-2) TaxID=502025 RepID=D0LNV2_HALO1|nr:SDR family oxidoreductase [Haliangium ochraceum]ACY18778.1 NmrA family protein [Haliangium ochraceum DSM 14365]
MKVLVVGATGPVGLGREVCRRLRARGDAVRALVRPSAHRTKPDVVSELVALGVEPMAADLKDRASLDALCRGVDAVVSTATTTASRQPEDTIAAVDLAGYHSLVYAAQAAGVARFVYTSYSTNTQRAAPCPLTWAKRAIEQLVAASGLRYAILRPSYFTEIWLGPMLGFDIRAARARIYGAGERPISWIATGDVAAFAVAALEHPEAENAALELGGPEALSPLDVVRLCERLGGRRFEVEHVSESAIEAERAAAFEAGDALAESVAALSLAYAAGDPIDTQALAARMGVPLHPVEQHLRAVLAAEG